MGTREQMLARMMADRYAYASDGYVERTAHWGDDVRHARRSCAASRSASAAAASSSKRS